MKRCFGAMRWLPIGLTVALAFLPAVCLADATASPWTVVAFSSQHADPGGANDFRAALAVDGDPDTFWCNDYKPVAPPPHSITLDLGSAEYLLGFQYLPRQDGYNGEENGNLGPYRIETSMDGVDFVLVHSGSFDPYSQKQSSVRFDQGVTARYFRLQTDMEWIGVAELAPLVGNPPGTTPTAEPTRTTEQPSVRTDRPIYEQGQDIVASFTGCTGRGGWIGICSADATRYPGHSLRVWLYANSGTKTIGAETRTSGEVRFSASLFASLLAPGEYAMYLMDEDWTTQVAETRFVVVEKGGDTTPPTMPDAPKGIAYVRTAEEWGYAAGRVTVTPPANDKGLRGFELFWADDSGRLPGYSHIAYLPYQAGEATTFDIPVGVVYPAGAMRIVAFARSWGDLASVGSASVDLDPAGRLPDSPLRFSFQVLSDLHITSDPSHLHTLHLVAALQDILVTDPGSAAIFTVGDNTDHGIESEWKLFQSTIAAVLNGGKPPLYATLGNHDVGPGSGPGDPVALYRTYTGAPGIFYRVEIEGLTFLVLASGSTGAGSGSAEIGQDQLTWLSDELDQASRKGGPIFVFLHQPMTDTVSGSLYSVDPQVQVWAGVVQEKEIRSLLDRYPQAMLFTGHSHWQFDSLQPLLLSDGSTANYLNSASVAYLWTDANQELEGSEGYFVEVHDDYVLVRGRDFVGRQWASIAQFLLPIRSPVPSATPTVAAPPEEKPGPDPTLWIVLVAVAVSAGLAWLLRTLFRKRR
jgi:hypothetical protein